MAAGQRRQNGGSDLFWGRCCCVCRRYAPRVRARLAPSHPEDEADEDEEDEVLIAKGCPPRRPPPPQKKEGNPIAFNSIVLCYIQSDLMCFNFLFVWQRFHCPVANICEKRAQHTHTGMRHSWEKIKKLLLL